MTKKEAIERAKESVRPSSGWFLFSVLHDLMSGIFSHNTTLSQAIIQTALLCRPSSGQSPYTVAELAAALGKPRSTVQRHVDSLIEQGLFRLGTDEDDARRHPVLPTPAGQALLQDWIDAVTDWRADFLLRFAEDLSRATNGATAVQVRFAGRDSSLVAFFNDVLPAVQQAARRHLTARERDQVFGILEEGRVRSEQDAA